MSEDYFEIKIIAILSVLVLSVSILPGANAQLRDSTSLELSPSSFTIDSGEDITLTATLTSDEEPLSDQTVEFGATNGSVDPSIGTTNSEGEVTVSYQAPEVSARTSVTVTAHFTQTTQYKSSSASASGTIEEEEIKVRDSTSLSLIPSSFTIDSGEDITLTAALTSDGEPVEGEPIEFFAEVGNVSSKIEETNSEGEVSITYTPSEVDSRTLTTVGARFAGTPKYESSSGRATGIIKPKTNPPETERLERTPENVYSYQSGIVFAKVMDRKGVKLTVKADVNISSTPLALSDLGLSDPNPIEYETRMVPVPQADGWYVTAIPPLPTKTFEFEALKENIKVLISSEVNYELYVEGEKVGEEGYRVRRGTARQELPPLVYTAVSDVIDDPSQFEETYGLGPEGWTVPGGESKETLTITLDDKGMGGLEDLTFQYKVGEDGWESKQLVEHPAMEPLRQGKESLNKVIDQIEEKIQDYKPGFEAREIVLPGIIAKAAVPAQPAGKYIQFRSTAEDVNGNTFTSPKGLYYTDDGNSETDILIVDPDVKSWLIQEDLEQLSETVRRNIDYQIPSEISNSYNRIERTAQVLENYGIVPFHHWEHLGQNYDLYITWPDEDVADLLENRVVIVLSDLWMGIRGMGEEAEDKIWNWDLRDKEVIDNIEEALNENHVGLISTHGTLSDWIVWGDCEENYHYKIGTRGHVGDDYAEDMVSDLVSDLNPVEEKTISAMHGMPQMPIYEYVRDKIAYYLCKSGEEAGGTAGAAMYASGLALGSTPQQVPFVPFEGKMVKTPEGTVSNFDIPDKFRIETPTAYEQIPEAGFESYTEVGWQLGMPRSLAYTAWDKAEETSPKVEKVYDRITKLVEDRVESLESEKLEGMVENSLQWALQNQYRMMSNAEIRGRTFHFELDIPGIENKIERSVRLEEESFKRLLRLLPRKLIARSENGLAGIITYDKYFVPKKGYRSVYFSPEIEASSSQTDGEIIRNAVEWTQEWKPLRERLLVFLENVPVSENLKHNFTDKLSGIESEKVMEKGLILNENGKNVLQFSAKGENKLHILVAHPTSKKVNCEIKGSGHVDSKTNTDKITNLTIQIEAKGSIRVELSAENASSILNPIFATAIGKNIERMRKATKQIAVEKTEDLPKKITLSERLSLTIGNVTPDTPINFEIENSKVEGLKIPINKPIDNMEVSIDKFKERPSEITEPPGLVHGYINISSNVTEDVIENSTITFEVSKEWLNTHGIPEKNVSLLRYREEKWENLPTKLIKENETHFKCSTKTPGFSTFAITGWEEEKPGRGLPLPLIGIGVAFIVIIVAIVIYMKRE